MNIVIYSKPNCSQCDSVKFYLKSNNISFSEQTLGIDFTREQLLEMWPNQKMFPVIVVDGFNVGTQSSLVKMITESNEDTRKLLNE